MPRGGVWLEKDRAAGTRDWAWCLSARTQFAHSKDGLADFMAEVLGDDAEATFCGVRLSLRIRSIGIKVRQASFPDLRRKSGASPHSRPNANADCYLYFRFHFQSISVER